MLKLSENCFFMIRQGLKYLLVPLIITILFSSCILIKSEKGEYTLNKVRNDNQKEFSEVKSENVPKSLNSKKYIPEKDSAISSHDQVPIQEVFEKQNEEVIQIESNSKIANSESIDIIPASKDFQPDKSNAEKGKKYPPFSLAVLLWLSGGGLLAGAAFYARSMKKRNKDGGCSGCALILILLLVLLIVVMILSLIS